MTKRRSILSAFVLTACSGDAAVSIDLCSSSAGYESRIYIELDERHGYIGFLDDVGRPLSRCAATGPACIDFPFAFSAPPRLPRDNIEQVAWQAGAYRFSMRMRDAGDQIYRIDVASGDPVTSRHAWRGRAEYAYHRDEGILGLRVEGGPHEWVRCGGRLTFDDLESVVRRLPQPALPAQTGSSGI